MNGARAHDGGEREPEGLRGLGGIEQRGGGVDVPRVSGAAIGLDNSDIRHRDEDENRWGEGEERAVARRRRGEGVSEGVEFVGELVGFMSACNKESKNGSRLPVPLPLAQKWRLGVLAT